MNTSSPADLAVAFRSLPRRLRDASAEDVPPAARRAAETAVAEALTRAAATMGTIDDAEAVAAAVSTRHASEWTDTDLVAVQAAADEAARAIRELSRLSER